jgi:ribose-phosphate pyrophosphokinase
MFAAHLLPLLHGREIAVVSPDAGGTKRAELFRATLARAVGADVPLCFLEKRRSGGVVGGQEVVVGSVEGRIAVIVDDLISTGTTLAGAAAACCAQGAYAAYATVTHGLFTGDAERIVTAARFERLIMTNTVPPFRLQPQTVQARIAVLDVAPLLAEAIRRLHREESLEGLDRFGLPQARASV